MSDTKTTECIVRVEKEEFLPGYYVTVGGARRYSATQKNEMLSFSEAEKLAAQYGLICR